MAEMAGLCYPVGALITQAKLVQTVRKAITPSWLKRGRNTCPFNAETKKGLMAIHLSPEACSELDNSPAEQKVPDKLSELLASGEVRWISGLRMGSRSCLGSTPDWQLHNTEREKKLKLQSTKSRKRKACDNSFAFIELFAGIGGDPLGCCKIVNLTSVFTCRIPVGARRTWCSSLLQVGTSSLH